MLGSLLRGNGGMAAISLPVCYQGGYKPMGNYIINDATLDSTPSLHILIPRISSVCSALSLATVG
jgi:hypothetical protein